MARSDRANARRPLVRAAGGLVWRHGPGGPELAVIHRPKHDDWSLPKGKLEPGESYHDAALREVLEETGCRATLREFAGYALYAVKGGEKIVLFWNMAVERAAAFTPNGEVDALVWLPPARALARLSHDDERAVLAGALAAHAVDARHAWRAAASAVAALPPG